MLARVFFYVSVGKKNLMGYIIFIYKFNILVYFLYVLFCVTNRTYMSIKLSLFDVYVFRSGFDFILDFQSSFFMLVVWVVSWSILSFSSNYISTEGSVNQFIIYLVMFIFFMLVLVISGNYYLLFVRWEGVGLISYLLISW